MIVTNKNTKYYFDKCALYLLLMLILIITVTPFFLMAASSFREKGSVINLSDIIPAVKEQKNILKNYYDVWIDGPFDTYFYNTVIVTLIVVLANLVFDMMAAYALSRKKFYGRKIVFLLILGRMMIPVQVLIIPIFILIKQLNLYDTLFALMLPNMIQGFGIFLMKQYFDSIPKTLDEAAIVDGASDFQILRYILVPISKPAIAVLIINTAISTWNSFLLPLILTQSVNNRVIGLGLALYKTEYSVDYVHSMAASTISVLPVLVLFIFFQKYIISGLMKGAVKQ